MIKRCESVAGRIRPWGLLLGIILLSLSPTAFPARAAELECSFRNPPATAKPLTWWHWLEGKIMLRQGANDLILKVGDHSDSWNLMCRLIQPNGDPLEGLTFRLP